MNARQKTDAIWTRINRGDALPVVDFGDVDTLRRAELTLHRWAEAECGTCGDRASVCIERDEATGKPFRVTYWNDGGTVRNAIPDREAGALRRVQAVCEANGLHYYHQTDPRGCALYVSREPMTDSNYSNRGIAVCA